MLSPLPTVFSNISQAKDTVSEQQIIRIKEALIKIFVLKLKYLFK